jgi:hypothetical protein
LKPVAGPNEDDGAVAECLHGILRHHHAALGGASAREDARLDELAGASVLPPAVGSMTTVAARVRIDTPVDERTRPSILRPSVVVSSTCRPLARGRIGRRDARRDLQPARIGDAEQLGFGRDELAEIGGAEVTRPETG